MTFQQGDIVLVPFPLTIGTSSKPRPAIIISNRLVNVSQDVILAQISSKPRIDRFSFKLSNDDLSNPLRLSSQVRCHKIFIVHKSLIFKKVSSLEGIRLEELIKKINSLLEVI